MRYKKIFFDKNYDRYILILKENNIIIDIDFMQGDSQDSYEILDNKDRKTNIFLLEIFNRLQNNKKFMNTKFCSEIEEINHAIELYVVAFIFSEQI